LAEQRRIIVDTSKLDKSQTTDAPVGYYPPTDSTPARYVIDPAAMVYQMKVDSINQVAEAKVKSYIEKLERKFQDPKVEEEMGKLIGAAVMEQQMALLDLQIQKAVSLRDTLLMMGIQTALSELYNNSPAVRDQIEKLQQYLETQLNRP
jgi:hypothetical protein